MTQLPKVIHYLRVMSVNTFIASSSTATVQTPPATRTAKPLPCIPPPSMCTVCCVPYSNQIEPRSKMDDMRQAFMNKQYDQAISFGKEALKTATKNSEIASVCSVIGLRMYAFGLLLYRLHIYLLHVHMRVLTSVKML